MFTITENTTNSIDISGIKFLWGTGDGGSYLQVNGSSGGKPVLFHDCYGEMKTGHDTGETQPTFGSRWSISRGVTWNNSWAAFGFTQNNQPYGIFASSYNAWTSLSTMGTSDVNGVNNFYIEDSDFHAFLNSMDGDENGKVVVRNCLFNNSGIGTHGADTSNYGVRHYEIYDNTFLWNGYSNGTSMNLTYYIFLRGGTGVITDNAITDITSVDYGNKAEIIAIDMNLQRNAGPNACWGANIAGNQYPTPRQVGMGRVTGTGVDGLGRSVDSITYVGDSEPLYIWNNTGTYVFSVQDYGGSDCTNPDSSANYIVAGRDYFNDGTAKPGYTKFTYPHPLRGGEQPAEIETFSRFIMP